MGKLWTGPCRALVTTPSPFRPGSRSITHYMKSAAMLLHSSVLEADLSLDGINQHTVVRRSSGVGSEVGEVLEKRTEACRAWGTSRASKRGKLPTKTRLSRTHLPRYDTKRSEDVIWHKGCVRWASASRLLTAVEWWGLTDVGGVDMLHSTTIVFVNDVARRQKQLLSRGCPAGPHPHDYGLRHECLVGHQN